MNCLHCDSRLLGPRRGFWFECPHCGLLSSNLVPSIDVPAPMSIDEDHRHRALERLRRANFERILDAVDAVRPPPRATVLDVGCAHGWFLDAAARRGYVVSGVEPDASIAAQARARHPQVVTGFFPDALAPEERFDLISFHDVFEHLPDPAAALAACRARLNDGGLLIVNLPSSKGALFRIARALDRCGVHGPFDRLWQRGFPSPHLTYFHPDLLGAFVARAGFSEICRGTLPSFSRSGLWQRIRYDRSTSLPAAAVLWMGLAPFGTVIGFLPADISYHVFRRE